MLFRSRGPGGSLRKPVRIAASPSVYLDLPGSTERLSFIVSPSTSTAFTSLIPRPASLDALRRAYIRTTTRLRQILTRLEANFELLVHLKSLTGGSVTGFLNTQLRRLCRGSHSNSTSSGLVVYLQDNHRSDLIIWA